MEGLEVYKESYKNLNKLAMSNTGGSITIDYTKLDNETQGALRNVITETINVRRNEISQVICGAK